MDGPARESINRQAPTLQGLLLKPGYLFSNQTAWPHLEGAASARLTLREAGFEPAASHSPALPSVPTTPGGVPACPSQGSMGRWVTESTLAELAPARSESGLPARRWPAYSLL
jgi:hypothetical protein